MAVNDSYLLQEVRPILTPDDGATQAAMARAAWIRSGERLPGTDSSVPAEFPNLALEGTGTSTIASQATATEAAAGSGSTPTTDGFTTTATQEAGLSNNGVLSAAEIVAALSGAPKVTGDPGDLSVSNPPGAPEAAPPSSDQLSQVASATAAVTTNTGEQGTGTIVNYNGADYLVTDGHVTGTNPNGIADGTNTPPASQVTATTADGTQLTLGPAIADPSNDLVAYPIQGASGQYTSLQPADESSLTDGQTMYSVNYGDGQLSAQSGSYLGQMPNIYFFPGGLTPDTGRDVGNTTMPADPGASGSGMFTIQNGQPVYNGTLDYGNGNTTQFTGTNALKNLLDSAAPSTTPVADIPAPTPAADTPAPTPAADTPAPTPAADTPTPTPAADTTAAVAAADTTASTAVDGIDNASILADLPSFDFLDDLDDLF